MFNYDLHRFVLYRSDFDYKRQPNLGKPKIIIFILMKPEKF